MTSCTANFDRTDAASIDFVRMAMEPLLDGQTDVLNRILAVLEASLEGAVDHKSDGPIELIVTQSIQRNFERRGMYPQFRPEFAAKVLPSKAGVFFVSLEQAEEMLQDAQEQRRKNDGPRGTASAFTSLIYSLERSIRAERFRGCVEFPGEEQAIAERHAASAIFDVGDRVEVWYDDGSKGTPVTIVSPYAYYFVKDDDGTYLSKGERVIYCQGYRASYDNGNTFFFYARQLTPVGKSYGHLRLVR